MNKIINVGRFNFLVTGEGRFISITAINTGTGLFVGGQSLCAPEDDYDIRVGVPLALKRALRQLKGVNRPVITRGFFREWPEAHPEFHDTPEQEKRKEFLTGIVPRHRQRQFRETVEARFNAVVDAVQEAEKTPEQHGRFKTNPVREFSICDSCGATHEVGKYPCP